MIIEGARRTNASARHGLSIVHGTGGRRSKRHRDKTLFVCAMQGENY
jgi:hypothetical protein